MRDVMSVLWAGLRKEVYFAHSVENAQDEEDDG
jgi:hypothetical protein